MNMTNYYHKKGNAIVKLALLNLIADIMKTHATASFTWLDEGYESDKQRIHFTSEGHKCILEGVGCPHLEDGTIDLKVVSELGRYMVTLPISEIHINTMEKIACEVYNTLWDGGIEDDEWDVVRSDYVGHYLDTFFYPEMRCMKKYKAQRSFD